MRSHEMVLDRADRCFLDLTFAFALQDFFTTTKELPFQAQIAYSRPDGTRALRVVTRTRPIAHARAEAESLIKAPVVAMAAVQVRTLYLTLLCMLHSHSLGSASTLHSWRRMATISGLGCALSLRNDSCSAG